jgi:hypothetical protein
MVAQTDLSPPRSRKTTLTPETQPCLPAFNSLVVMAVDSMLRKANRAQAGIQRLHDQALVGAACPAVGFAKGEAFACWHSTFAGPTADRSAFAGPTADRSAFAWTTADRSAWPSCLEHAG